MNEICRRLELYREEQDVMVWFSRIGASSFTNLKLRAESFLTGPELAYFHKLEFKRRQKSYVMGRYAGKQACAAYMGNKDPLSLEITKGCFDQPLVCAEGRDLPGVSISHTEGIAVALAFPQGHPMGIDVEMIDPQRIEVIRSQLTEDETRMEGISSLSQATAWTMMWTIKEALSKALRCGLMIPMTVLEIAELKVSNNGRIWHGLYRNFAQYQCWSWLEQELVISIASPQRTRWLRPSLAPRDFSIQACLSVVLGCGDWVLQKYSCLSFC